MRGPRLATLLLLATGCNRYELFRVAGYQQESFSNRADVLFVIDNSDSMLEESESLAVNFADFIQDIQATEDTLTYDGLPDAVTNYVDYVQNRSAFIDYQFGITTTDVATDRGELLGSGLMRRSDENVADAFIENLVCEATCFRDDAVLPSDPDHQCGDPIGGFLTTEYLDCTCGAGSWRGNCGAAVEEGIEAVFLAMCRAVENPPVECFADVDNGEEQFPSLLDQGDVGTNAGLMRPRANLIPVIVTDEGDGSRRLNREEIPDAYVNLFQLFGTRMSWVLIGPGLQPDNTVRCPGTASDWGVVRYNYLVYTTDGMSVDIFDSGCDTQDFGTALEQLGALLTNLLTSFPLQSVPVPGTVTVLVDGGPVDEATITGQDQFGLDLYSDGWSYRAVDNAIIFHGAAVPSYDAKVEVYYLPVDGMPRELPF